MKNTLSFFTLYFCLTVCPAIVIAILSMGSVFANPPDSVYIKAFSTGKNNHKNGLHIAYSVDKKAWKTIGDDFSFLKSDYGMWSAEKRMLNPQLWRDNNGLWYCLFDVNETAGVQGVASSRDLILWKPQDYFVKGEWSVPGRPAKTDTIFKVSWAFLQNLLNHVQLTGYNNRLYAETTAQDSERFAGLKNVHMKITPDFSNPKKISDKLLGVFFEDINYAADGGLYAELVQNRDFELLLSAKHFFTQKNQG